jgi:hypothetical protein
MLFTVINVQALAEYEIPNSKHPARKTAGRQIANKSQIPILNIQTFGILNFGHWDLFEICDLGSVI